MNQSLAEFAPTIYRYLLRTTGNVHLAEDLTQETLLRGWRARAQLRDPNRTKVWLLRIANNAWYDHQRSKKRKPAHETLLDSAVPIPPTQEKLVSDQEQVEMALAAMQSLPPRQREVMHLSVCENLSLAEIAEVLEIDRGTVKSNMSLARQRLRSRLKNLLPQETRNIES